MLTLKIRRGIVYAATGMFFVVAAMGQVQGATGADVFVKATVACLVLTAIGMALVRIIEDAAQRMEPAAAAGRPRMHAARSREGTGQG